MLVFPTSKMELSSMSWQESLLACTSTTCSTLGCSKIGGRPPPRAGRSRIFLKCMYFMPEFLSDCPTPCFLESVFYQELEKTGFGFVRDRESDEIHLFLYRSPDFQQYVLFKT